MRASNYRNPSFVRSALVLVIALAPAVLCRDALGTESLVNCPPTFVGEYPADFEGDWTDNIQGLAHDDTHWYLTQTLDIFRIPVGRDFSQDHEGEPGVAHRHRDSYPELLPYDHFGDIAFFNGYVLLALDTGPPEGALGLLRGDDTLDLVGVQPFPGQSSAGWVAVDPDGYVYSSVSGATEFRKYEVNWASVESGLTVTFVAAIPLTDENGDPYQLFDMQGGVVTPDGKVIIISNGYDDCDNPTYGLHAFNLQTGQRIIRSCESGCGWIFQWDPCDFGIGDEEPEGLDIWDLDNGAAPGMSAQLHVLLLNNDLLTDNAWIKHYALDMTPPETTCPDSIVVECSQHGGTPATDPAIAAFLTSASATDNCDDDVDITHDAPSFFNLGTTTVTFTATDDVMANQSTCTADITIVDTTAPEIAVSLNRDVLWPPNHKLADIEPTVEVTDVCDADATFVLSSVDSNEPDDDLGDGNTTGDIVGAEIGTADTAFQLRSERQGTEAGREYEIIYCASDESGNVAYDTVSVRVPHDQSSGGLAALGFSRNGRALNDGADQFAVIIPASAGMDAAAVDASHVYLGNTAGVARPLSVRVLDANADHRADLALIFDAASLSTFTAAADLVGTGGDGTLTPIDASDDDGPVGIHFVSPTGVDYLINDIFALGKPVAMPIFVVDPPQPIDRGIPTGQQVQSTGLSSIHPNPFNPQTTVEFALSSPEHVRVYVYDVRGSLVRRLVDDDMPMGEHNAVWNGVDDAGRTVTSGIYFVRMTAGRYEQTRKIVMLK